MVDQEDPRPWEELERLVDDAPPDDVDAYLGSQQGSDTMLSVSRLPEDDQTRLLTRLSPGGAAGMLEALPDVQAADLIGQLEPDVAATIVQEMPSDAQVELLRGVSGARAERILARMDPQEAAAVRALCEYSPDVAGGIMCTEFVSYPETATVASVVEDLRQNAERYALYNVQYAYVIGRSGQLAGVLRLRDLLLSPGGKAIAELMIRDPIAVHDATPLEELKEHFGRHQLYGMPVVSDSGELVGVVHRHALTDALAARAATIYRRSQGILEEELRSMPLILRTRRRLVWLSLNIGLNVIAASVIAVYQDTLSQVIALAVFLPVISDMSGCSGNQAVAVSMRELALGVVRPNEALRVWLKEVSVGLLNGLALGVLVALVGGVWFGNPWFGAVIGVALAVNTVVAVSVGGSLPLIIKRFGFDPALASGPILTTITDMCGFFLVLALASLVLQRLL